MRIALVGAMEPRGKCKRDSISVLPPKCLHACPVGREDIMLNLHVTPRDYLETVRLWSKWRKERKRAVWCRFGASPLRSLIWSHALLSVASLPACLACPSPISSGCSPPSLCPSLGEPVEIKCSLYKPSTSCSCVSRASLSLSLSLSLSISVFLPHFHSPFKG